MHTHVSATAGEAAAMLTQEITGVIGVVVPDLSDPFFAALSSAIQDTASEAGFVTLCAASGHRLDLEASAVETMLQRGIVGMLAVTIGHQNRHFAQALSNGVPVIAIDRPMDNVTTDSIVVDNADASYHATRHLIAHGHHQVLCVADDEVIYTKNERVRGYERAMQEAGLTAQVNLVGPTTGTVRDRLDSALVRRGEERIAIFAASNMVAEAVLRDLQHRQTRLPDEVALIAFDDFSAATLVLPAVTVVQQPVAELGRRACILLIDRIHQRSTGASLLDPQTLMLRTSLVVRGSCGCYVGGRTKG